MGTQPTTSSNPYLDIFSGAVNAGINMLGANNTLKLQENNNKLAMAQLTARENANAAVQGRTTMTLVYAFLGIFTLGIFYYLFIKK